MRQRQQGMTMIGLLFILGLVGLPLYAGIRLAPLYLNYMKVARSIEEIPELFESATREAVAAFGLFHEMRRNENGNTFFVAQHLQVLPKIAPRPGIEAGRGFIQQ